MKLGKYFDERIPKMYDLYREGKSLADIGAEYGISRERVRQLFATCKINRSDSGKAKDAKIRRKKVEIIRKRKREQRAKKLYGMTFEEMKSHINEYGDWKVLSSPIAKYRSQKNAAKQRGVKWEFTFSEWWKVWIDSGKWSQRGRGFGYVMARKNDVGAYCSDNVYICTSSQNVIDSWIFKPAENRNLKSKI